MSMRRIGIVLGCSLIASMAMASPGSRRVPYGSFPIAGPSLARLRKDMRADASGMRLFTLTCRNPASRKKVGICDADGDRIVNRREKLLGTKLRSADSDNDRLNDRLEIMRYHTNPLVADTDGDGVSDGDEALDDHTDPRVPDPAGDCGGLNFDDQGNTSAFGIPAPHVGNVARGVQAYSESCGGCHAGVDKGAHLAFSPLKARIAQAPMMITSLSDARLADITAYLHRAESGTVCTPTPSASPTASPSASVSPTPMPTSGCANQFFDASGNTTQFGIPSPFIGNISQGASYNSLGCLGCHSERGTNFTFSQLKTAVTGPLMNITSVSDQQFANLVAYLNRSKAAQNCGNPTPTPSPVSDFAAGQIVFQTNCQTCHAPTSGDVRRKSANAIREAIREVDEMQGIVLSNEQMRVLVIYLATL